MEDLDEAVARVLAGDAMAFQTIVERTSQGFVRLSARILGNVSDAEDVVQEAYVKAYRAIIEGRFDRRAKLETWLRRIVVNTGIDAMRVRKRAPRLEQDVLDRSVDASASAETALALGELSDWLAELPPDQRATLVLKTLEGLSSREIGEALNCTEGAVEQRLMRARAALRERMNA